MRRRHPDIATLTSTERLKVLDVLVAHLESGSDLAGREYRAATRDDLQDLAQRIRGERQALAGDTCPSANAVIAQAIEMLRGLYEGRDPGWGLLH